MEECCQTSTQCGAAPDRRRHRLKPKGQLRKKPILMAELAPTAAEMYAPKTIQVWTTLLNCSSCYRPSSCRDLTKLLLLPLPPSVFSSDYSRCISVRNTHDDKGSSVVSET